MMKTNTAIAILMLLLCTTTVHATLVFDWATVGNAGNTADSTGFGAVACSYLISKHEVTNAHYATFLNSVAATDSYGLYNANMGSNARGGITRSGTSGSFTYATKTNMENKPVNFVSFSDAMRFTNWLQNGQGSGSTESGVYTIGNGVNETRNPSATYFIPSENEWYKAAFHKNNGVTGGAANYFDYPTSSDTVPTVATANATGDVSNPGANVANYARGADWNEQDGNVTTVGSATSTSPYGTFDQGGNVFEWNEAVISSSFRGLRGGDWSDGDSSSLAASIRGLGDPAFEGDFIGFRVASKPEPSLSCDFNSDSACNIHDLNAMLAVGPIAPGVTVTPGVNGQFDLTGDGVINNADAEQWLSDAATVNQLGSPYKRGDANLDGVVDGSDFGLWNAGKFTSTLFWDRGDFSGDGVADGSDFGIWNSNKFTSSDGASAVPEPVASALAFVAALLWGIGQRRRQI